MVDKFCNNILLFIRDNLHINIYDDNLLINSIKNMYNTILIYDKKYFDINFNGLIYMVFCKYNIINKNDIKFVDNFSTKNKILYNEMKLTIYNDIYIVK